MKVDTLELENVNWNSETEIEKLKVSNWIWESKISKLKLNLPNQLFSCYPCVLIEKYISIYRLASTRNTRGE